MHERAAKLGAAATGVGYNAYGLHGAADAIEISGAPKRQNPIKL